MLLHRVLGSQAAKEGKILKATLTDILQSLLTQSTPVWFAVQVYFSCAAIPVECFSMSLGGLASKDGRILKEYLLDIHQSILTYLPPVWFAVQVYFSCAANHVECFSPITQAKHSTLEQPYLTSSPVTKGTNTSNHNKPSCQSPEGG